MKYIFESNNTYFILKMKTGVTLVKRQYENDRCKPM